MHSFKSNFLWLVATASIVLFLCSSIVVAQSEQRTWTSSNGKFKIEATLESSDDNVVKLKKTNGKVVEVPLAKLCDADREYLSEQAENEADETPSNATVLRGLLQAGIPEDGFAWGKVDDLPNSGGSAFSSICRKDGTNEYVQVVLFSQKYAKEKERIEFIAEFLEGAVEGLQEEGLEITQVTGPEQRKRKKNQYEFTIKAKTAQGATLNTVSVVKFGETSMLLVANSERFERAVELSSVADRVNELKGKEFKEAVEGFRRFKATDLGLSLKLPPGLDVVARDGSSISFQSPAKEMIFIRSMQIDGDFEIDKAWTMIQRMAIAPSSTVTDEGKAKIDGADSRFKSYFKDVRGEAVWATTWMVPNGGRFYLITGQCLKNEKDRNGKELLKSIKGVKLLSN